MHRNWETCGYPPLGIQQILLGGFIPDFATLSILVSDTMEWARANGGKDVPWPCGRLDREPCQPRTLHTRNSQARFRTRWDDRGTRYQSGRIDLFLSYLLFPHGEILFENGPGTEYQGSTRPVEVFVEFAAILLPVHVHIACGEICAHSSRTAVMVCSEWEVHWAIMIRDWWCNSSAWRGSKWKQ